MKKIHLLFLLFFVAVSGLYGQYSETFSDAGQGYLENFVNQFGGVDWTLTDWRIDDGNTPFGRDSDDYFKTIGGVLQAKDVDVEVCWLSPVLTISGGSASFELDLSWVGFDGANADYIDVAYRTSSGSDWSQLGNAVGSNNSPHTVGYTDPNPNTPNGDYTGSLTNFGASGIPGSTLQIRVCTDQNSLAELVSIDNVSATNATAAPSCDLTITQISSTGEGCPNADDGTITLLATSSNGPVTYSISGPVDQSNGTGLFTGLPDGTYSILITDEAGCEQTGSRFIAAGADGTVPTITCPTSIIEPNDIGRCSAVVTYATPTGSDNCGIPSISRIGGPASGSAFSVGTTLVTYEATDVGGNTKSCSFTVTVIDRDYPVAGCRPITINLGPGGVYNLTSAEIDAGSYDNCGPVTLSIPPTSFDCDDVGSTFPVLLTVTDGSINTDICVADVTVADGNSYCNQAPMAVCRDITVSVDGSCTAGITPDQINNGSSDPDGDPVTLSLDNEGPFSPGTYTVELTASDGILTGSCTATVIVEDNILPEIVCPPNIETVTEPGTCSAVVTYTPPVGVDNCSGAVTTLVIGQGSGGTFLSSAGAVNVEQYRVVDAAGNAKECGFTIKVIDTELPSITCPSNITVSNNAGLCGAVVIYSPPIGTDNCPGTSTIQTIGLGSGALFPVGVTIEQYEVTDASENKKTCEFTVTVKDTEVPAISCPGNITVSNDAGDCGAVVTYIPPVGTDNCPGVTTDLISPKGNGDFFPLGITPVLYEAADASGNTKSCSFSVTVKDTEVPAISCPGNITVSNDAGDCGAVVTYIPPVGTDNCPGATTTLISPKGSGDFFPVGATSVIYEADDASGNTKSCSFTVTVKDTQKPVLICSGNIVQTNDPGDCGARVNFDPPSAVDNCPGAVITRLSGINTGSLFPVGMTLQKYKVVDASGNVDECQFTVTVYDDEAAVARCKSATIVLDNAGMASLTAAHINNGSSDNCDVPSLSIDLDVFDCYELGDHIVRLTAEDSKGQSSTCTAVVTVEGADADCDGVADLCDLCPGGDDKVDNDQDGFADCAYFPGLEDLIDDWTCGGKGNKVQICHIPGGKFAKRKTICVSPNAVAAHLAHGDFVGPCDNVSCDDMGSYLTQQRYTEAMQEFRMFPNPASQKVQLDLSLLQDLKDTADLVIFSNIGQLIYSESLDMDPSGLRDLDITAFSPGIYLVQLRVNGVSIASSKLIVSR